MKSSLFCESDFLMISSRESFRDEKVTPTFSSWNGRVAAALMVITKSRKMRAGDARGGCRVVRVVNVTAARGRTAVNEKQGFSDAARAVECDGRSTS